MAEERSAVPGAAPPTGEAASPVTAWRFLRATAVGVALLPVTVYWAADQLVDVILSLMVPPVAVLMVVVLANLWLRRRRPRWAFSSAELVLIYSILASGTAVAAEWSLFQTPLIYAFALFGNPGNHFDTLMLPNLPPSLYLKDADALHAFLSGGRGWADLFGHLGMWACPVLLWTALASSLCLAMQCINSLMRRQWTQREKLTFPLIQLPLALVEGPGHPRSPWRDPLLWTCFSVVAAIDLVNGLHFLFPTVPLINTRFLGDINTWLSRPPWNQTGWTPIGLFPFIVALGTFLPTDLIFSAVVFYFVRKAQQVIAFSMGYPQGLFGGGYLTPSPPYFSEQTWGAFLALFFIALWNARDYLRDLWRRVLRGDASPEDVPPRLALAGLGVGAAGVVLFAAVAGLPIVFGMVYVGVFLLFSVALTRLRAELGPPTHEMAFMGPNQLLVDAMGTESMATRTVVGMNTTLFFMNRIHRTHPMPGQLEAMKLGERKGLDQRWLAAALLLAVVAGSLMGHLIRIYLGYRWGPKPDGSGHAAIVNDLTGSPRQPNPTAMGFVGLGFFVVCALNVLRFRFPGLPLNPVGYALAMNFGVDYYWFGLILAWILKGSALRFAGMKGYRRLHAAMIGVIVAEFAVEAVWSAVAMIWHIPTYSVSINGRIRWDQ